MSKNRSKSSARVSQQEATEGLHHQRIQTADQVQIEVLQAGSPQADALVFIPGLGAHLEQFRAQVQQFSSQYHTLALSLRGHGQSSCPANPGPDDFSLTRLAADVQRIFEQQGIVSAHLVGNSTGGLVAYEVLARAPQFVRSITTFGTAAELHTGAMGRIVVWLDRLLGSNGDAWLAQRSVSKQPAVARFVADMIRSTPKAAIVNLRRNLIDYTYLPTLRAHPDLPLLLIQGEQDQAINQALASTLALLQQRPTAHVVRLANAGHFANLDQPAAFNQVLASFLQEVTQPASPADGGRDC